MTVAEIKEYAKTIADYIKNYREVCREENTNEELIPTTPVQNDIEHLVSMLDQLDEWVSVDDRLPTPSEDKKYLLCGNNNTYAIATYEYAGSGDVYFFDYEGMRLHNVIAWRKIEPYKESE